MFSIVSSAGTPNPISLAERKLSLDAISHISTNNENNFVGQNEGKKISTHIKDARMRMSPWDVKCEKKFCSDKHFLW